MLADLKIATLEAFAYMEFEEAFNYKTMYYLPAIRFGNVLLWKGSERCDTEDFAIDMATRHLESRLQKIFE